MKLLVVKIIFEVLLVPNKRVFRIQVNYVIKCPEKCYSLPLRRAS